MIVFLDRDAIKYIKRDYIKTCIVMVIGFACLYTLCKTVEEQEEIINNLYNRKNKELKTKGE